jgi:Protein of unknown function (DUF2442)
MGADTKGRIGESVRTGRSKAARRSNKIALLPRIKSVEVVMHGVLKLQFLDGYEGVVDLRPLIANGDVFAWIRNKQHFANVQLEEFGHSVLWVDDTGYEIDLGADGLRRDCERQADIHKLMTVS